MPAEAAARCPITDAPATLLRTVPAKLVHDLWRHGARVRPTPLRRDAPRIGLWRSPCDLLFWHPAPAGDRAFYAGLYGRYGAQETPRRAASRHDMRLAAALIPVGARVLDVGCGAGAFAALVPQASCTGLEPHGAAAPGILVETVAAHAARHPAAYDAVCAFQVLEHAADPRGMARAMARCLRPGGLLVLSMPCWPSPLTTLPNNPVNLPPHHLTLWSEAACAALCDAVGVTALRIGPVPASRTHAVGLWAARCLRATPEQLPVRAGWGGHLRLAAAYAAARALAALFGLPPRPAPIDVVVVARRSG